MNTETSTEISEMDYLKTWFLFFICATLGGAIVGGGVGGILGGFLGVAHVPIQTIRWICGGAGFIVGLPISYAFFRLFVSRFIVRKLIVQNGSALNQMSHTG